MDERIRQAFVIERLQEEWEDLIMISKLFVEELLSSTAELKVVDPDMYDALSRAKREASVFIKQKQQFDDLLNRNELEAAIEFTESVLFRNALSKAADSNMVHYKGM